MNDKQRIKTCERCLRFIGIVEKYVEDVARKNNHNDWLESQKSILEENKAPFEVVMQSLNGETVNQAELENAQRIFDAYIAQEARRMAFSYVSKKNEGISESVLIAGEPSFCVYTERLEELIRNLEIENPGNFNRFSMMSKTDSMEFEMFVRAIFAELGGNLDNYVSMEELKTMEEKVQQMGNDQVAKLEAEKALTLGRYASGVGVGSLMACGIPAINTPSKITSLYDRRIDEIGTMIGEEDDTTDVSSFNSAKI